MTRQIHELGSLFEEVQLKNLLGDGKTFPDCIPKHPTNEIEQAYAREKNLKGFDLKKFVLDNFNLPNAYAAGYTSDASKTPKQHIETLWDVLTRQPDAEGGSLLPLPHPYLVPGGRFREIYYWDSYFSMLGLRVSKRWDLIHHMVDNFSYLIQQAGYIPNGNRSYFLGRSQPPFFSLMVKLLAQENLHDHSGKIHIKYLKSLEKEHNFWMRGMPELTAANHSWHRVVHMPDGSVLNRYWDDHNTPRPEAYKEDVELSHQSTQSPEILYRHLRAAAESGWDFSTRWFQDEKSFGSIHTTDIVPVDLNCLLWHLEETLSDAYQLAGDSTRSLELMTMAERRKETILKYCWNEEQKFFFDIDMSTGKQTNCLSLAGMFPLYFELASTHQAEGVEAVLRSKFLKPGGLTTTLTHSGQQWDAPNGWAPLQWIAYRGLLHYGFRDLAHTVKSNWMNANLQVYQKTGKMTEKYDVWSHHAEASGGEYPNQDGFGWTNGVFLAMAHDSN